MQRLRKSWFLVRFDLVRHGMGYILSVLFFGYGSGMVLMMFQDMEGKDASSFNSANLIIDLYFLCILGLSGFAFASLYYRMYWRSKSFSKKAIFLKSYPISARETVESKIMSVIIHVIGQGGVFFSVMYFGPSPLQELLSVSQYFEFIIMWLAYAFVWGCFYAYMEISFSEKAYLWGCIGIAILYSLVLCLGWLADYPLVQHSIGWIQQYGIWAPLGSLVVSAAALLIFHRAGIKKIHSRDLYL
ncbi:hypothetical protein EHS13_30180 [Paenibacillus psychroresistens]|uniref:ABC transporter permease n=1 Tax=Paenibacillus psychroresistens TaxID=1778678 RepID=A0A6B8RU82_9BACL|nr:hypothetical protein [Paenibacillus psychroresistens]QGQ98846.1 hypothetical protein EHS13_30180 [Paenibacillus psychroresistens]